MNKKIIFLITLSYLSLLNVQADVEVNSKLENTIKKTSSLDTQYKEALSAYKAKDFSKSYEILSKLYLTRLSSIDLNYQLGRSAYETGNYEVALAAFERVEMLDGGNVRNKLEMARTYFMLKMYEESENAFTEVLQNQSIPDNVRRNIELYLAKTVSVQKRSYTYGTVGLDILYDSNINFASLDSSYQVGGITLPTLNEIDGMAAQIIGDITNIYDIGDKNGYAIKNKATIFVKDQFNSNHSDYDIGYLAYTPSLIYQETKFTEELALDFSTLYLGQKRYLQSYAILPKFDWNHTSTLKSLTYIKYSSKDYLQEAQKDLDANHYELSYALQSILSPSSYIQGTLIGMAERKKQGTRPDVNFDEYNLNLNYSNQLDATYGLDFFGQFRQRSYKDYTSIFESRREDSGATLSVGGTAEVVSEFVLRVKAQYNMVSSNQNIYSYDKSTLTVGIAKAF